MKNLTKAEDQVMRILWELERGFIKDILDRFPEPKPAYNTVSTIVRILENKGFVDHTAYGKTYEYYPVVSQDEYKKQFLSSFVQDYFEDSYRELVSFFAKGRNLSVAELEEMLKLIEEQIQKKKADQNE
jgi:BlaI family penicillinase repressor